MINAHRQTITHNSVPLQYEILPQEDGSTKVVVSKITMITEEVEEIVERTVKREVEHERAKISEDGSLILVEGKPVMETYLKSMNITEKIPRVQEIERPEFEEVDSFFIYTDYLSPHVVDETIMCFCRCSKKVSKLKPQ